LAPPITDLPGRPCTAIHQTYCSLAALLAHIPLEELDAVWISHTHADRYHAIEGAEQTLTRLVAYVERNRRTS
jgi:hypothetical protein